MIEVDQSDERLFGAICLNMFRVGNDTLQIATKLRILKPSGKPNEAKVCDILHAARAAEKQREPA